MVLDEFPYLAKANPELPSIVQEALRPLRDQRTGSRTRLLLCGSALSFMGRLLSGSAPLRGRAGLELVVRPLDHRLAAEFWNITDPRLALQVNSIVSGTPAYRREFARGDSPAGPEDFDDWVVRKSHRGRHAPPAALDANPLLPVVELRRCTQSRRDADLR